MRLFYLLLVCSLNISLRLFYKRIQFINKPKRFFNRTIYVSNHPNSFMDPIMLGALSKSIFNFMTRSDVFKWWLKPFLWLAHMLPIYRQHDGENTQEKNKTVFNRVNKTLANGRNILIFGEGFTDDTPIRGLKPIKKGAVRMGLTALEGCNWEKNIYLASIGINYTDRNTIGSELLVEYGGEICLNDYRKDFEENTPKAINDITKKLEGMMQDCVIYVADKSNYAFIENIMQITRKGFNHANHDDTIALKARFEYSKKLAHWINENATEENEAINQLKKELNAYFALEKRMQIQDRFVVESASSKTVSRSKELFLLATAWPIAILGAIQGFIPYFLAKKLTEKIMKRKVFWGSVKMLLGKVFGTIYSLPIVIWLTKNYFPHWSFGVIYFLFVAPVLWKISYDYGTWFKEYLLKGKMKRADLSKFVTKRQQLAQQIAELVPVA